jgi:hypothetical protein
MITVAELLQANVFPVPDFARKPPIPEDLDVLTIL